MPIIKTQAQIDEMRRRLYERGGAQPVSSRHSLSSTPNTSQTAWPGVQAAPVVAPPLAQPEEIFTETEVATLKKRRFSYRSLILLVTLGSFLLVMGVSSLYLMFGNTQISSKNIGVVITGPLTIGGGQEMELQIAVSNQNKVPIESAVLIINYPSGTKSVGEDSKTKLEERISLNRINAGEAVTVPVSAIMFAEENKEEQIRATIEYRLVDSNGTFYKEADPLIFKINSSPLVISIDSVKKVSAGQEVEVKMTIKSNAPATLRDILVSANYPSNFDYSSASPEPAFRDSSWLIKEIPPEKSVSITIKGAIVGQQAEEFQLQFSAGTAQADNQFTIGSILANATADFIIEQPFINVGLSVNNIQSEVVTLQTGDSTQVKVTVQNTLSETLYDMSVEVGIRGNVLVRDSVNVQNGFYDSVKDVIRFDPSGDAGLSEINPGATKTFSFTLRPSGKKETPSFSLTANAYARRVQENQATEQLVGTAKGEVKFTSSVGVTRLIARNVAGIVDSGPVPPVADTETTYSVTLEASAGGNDVTGGVLVTSLPQYVNWKNLSSGDGSLVFNPISKELAWTVGTITAGTSKTTTFQIGLLPSQNQIGTTPAVLGSQRFRATDRFTGSVVRAEGAPASSELGLESGLEERNGLVQPQS